MLEKSTKELIDDIDNILNGSDDESAQEDMAKFANMSLEEMRDAFGLNELTLNEAEPEPKKPRSALQTPSWGSDTNLDDPQPSSIPINAGLTDWEEKEINPTTGANAEPINLKIKVPRPPSRPTDPRPAARLLMAPQNIKELAVRLICQQPEDSRPDNIYLGEIRHPYMFKAIRGCHLYNSIIKDAKTFLLNINPFNKVAEHMRLEMKQPKFTYISDTGVPISLSGSSIPRPYSNSIPEPLYTGCSLAIMTLYFSIDVIPRAPKKFNRKRMAPDHNGPKPKRQSLPPTPGKKYLYKI